jgi:hypothetical protein
MPTMNFCVINTATSRIIALFVFYADAQRFLNTLNPDMYTIQEN